MVAKVAMVAIFQNVDSVGIEKRVVTPAMRELDTGVTMLRHCGLGLTAYCGSHLATYLAPFPTERLKSQRALQVLREQMAPSLL
jgi:hypothetical protein